LYFYRQAFLFFILAVLILITGCSSSSNTIRYGSNDDKKDEKENTVRYGKSENEEPKENTVSLNDEEEDPDETPDDLTPIDISVLEQKYNSTAGNSGIISGTTTLRETMLMEIIKYMNTPYKFGGNSKEGIDCSAFTQTIYNSCSLQLLRSAGEQFTQGVVIDKRDDLKFGDLVFFNTRKSVKPGHVGIYVGDNLFVHASKHGVIVTPLDHDYYSKRYMGARRIEQ
jgi:cell wall-associated NlpC family hydrolase